MTTGIQLVQSAARTPRARPQPPQVRLVPMHSTHPERRGFEGFIAERFHRAYGAQLTHFLPHLLGVMDGLGRWQAAAGYAAAGAQTLFLEQYFDRPVEQALGAAVGRPIARGSIVEVGNLAAISAGMARALIPQLARHLHRMGYRWVAFTATRALRNAFHRLGLTPLPIAAADRTRLADRGVSWGTYYDQDPVVMAGKISLGVKAGEHASD